MVDRTKLAFYGADNTMKIAKTDSVAVSIASTFNENTFKYDFVSKKLYSHNLGYIPRARVWYEPVPGEWWPITNSQFDNFDGGGGTEIFIFGTYYLTTSGLYAYVKNASGSTQTVTFKYRVYYDS